MSPGRGPAQTQCSKDRYFYGPNRGRRAGLYVLLEATPGEDPLDEPDRASQWRDQSAAPKCLVGAILLEQNDEWVVQLSRYRTVKSFATLSDDALVSLPEVAV